MTIRVAIIGVGKIARDEHLPAIAADPRFILAAVVARGGDPELECAWFSSHEALLEQSALFDAVAICTPPHVRPAIARACIAANKHVLLEKPPASTVGEAAALGKIAHDAGVALYGAWHSAHAPAVAAAKSLLEGREIERLQISWREDVRKYHGGQDWVFAADGLGVFDPGVNALSIAARLLPAPLLVEQAELSIPANRAAPIAARLTFYRGEAVFDWRLAHDEEWTIAFVAGGQQFELRDGGGRLLVDGREKALPPRREYPAIYARFAELVEQRAVELDLEPLRIVADAFLIGERRSVEPFDWSARGSARTVR